MSDLTRKIVEKITEEISKERTDNRIGQISDAAAKGGQKETVQEKEEAIKIRNPEISFIFTIALNGKIDITDEIVKSMQRQNKRINRSNKDDDTKESENGNFSKKYASFDNTLDDILTTTKKKYMEEGGNLRNLPEEIFKLAMSFSAEVKLFAVGAISILIKKEQPVMAGNGNDISLFSNEIVESLRSPNLSVARSGFVVNCKKPEIKREFAKEKEVSGFLNMFACGLASHLFNEFFRCLSNSQNSHSANPLKVQRIGRESKKNRRLITDMFERGMYTDKIIKAVISRSPNCRQLSDNVNLFEDEHGNVYIVYRGDPKKQDELLLYKQYEGSKDDLISLTRMFSIIKKPPGNRDIELPKELLAFYEDEKNPDNVMRKFLLKKELKKISGKLWDAPLFVHPYVNIGFNSDSNSTSGTPYDTSLFCLESILATTKSVNSFYKELEKDVFSTIDNMLNKRLNNFWISFYKNKPVTYIGMIAGLAFLFFAGGMSATANCSMAVFIVYHLISVLRSHHMINKSNEIINKARTLSPCEDFSPDIVSALETGTKEARIVKDSGLGTLINSIRKRLENHENFVKSCYGSLIVQANWIVVFLLLYIGMANLLFSDRVSFSWRALMKNFSVEVNEHESLIQFLINLIL